MSVPPSGRRSARGDPASSGGASDPNASAPVSRSVRFAFALCCVLAVLAVAASLVATPAAAEPTVDDVTVEDGEAWIGTEKRHRIDIEASGINTTDGPATVTVALSGWPNDAIVGGPTVDVASSGVAVDGNVRTDGTTITFDVDDPSRETIDLEATVGVTLSHPLSASVDGNDYSVDVDVDGEGSTGDSAGMTLKRVAYSTNKEAFPSIAGFVHRPGMEITVSNLEPGTDYNLYEFDPDEGELGERIRSVSTDGSSTTIEAESWWVESGQYIVSDGNDVVPAAANAFRIRTDDLQATQADGTVDAAGPGSETSVTFDSSLRYRAFDVYVSADTLDADDLFDVFEGEKNRNVEHVYRSDSKIVIRGVEPGDEIPMTFEPLPEGTYNFEYETVDTAASDATAVSVEEAEVDAEFGSDSYEVEAGNVVEVDLSLENTNEAYVMIGGDRFGEDRAPTNYFDILHVEGDTTVRINTRLLGTNVPSEEAYAAESGQVTSYLHEPSHEGFDDVTFEGGVSDLAGFRWVNGVGPLSRPLQPERFRLVAGAWGSVVVRDDGVPDFERPLDRSNLRITDTDGFENVTTYVAPEGSASEYETEDELDELEGSLTERRTVAKGDRLVFEIEADGITGLVSWLDERLGDGEDIEIDHETLETLLEFPDGVVLDAEQTNPDPNTGERAAKFDLEGSTDGDLYMVHEPMTENGSQFAIERYYLVLDTRNSGPFDREIEAGDEYRFRFGYAATGETDWFETVDHAGVDPNDAAPHFPYYDAYAEPTPETRLVTVEERSVEYNRTDSRDRPVIRIAEESTLSGRTNLAPGTEISIQLVADNRTEPIRATIDDVDVAEDGSFSVTRDLTEFGVDDEIDVEFYVDQQLLDKRPAVPVGPDEPLVEYRITEHTESATVTRGVTPANVSATVENVGYVPGDRSITLSAGGETVADRPLELDEGEAGTVDFEETIGLEPGEYTYTIATGDDEATGQLTVEPNENVNGTDEGGSDGGSGDEGSPFGNLLGPLEGVFGAVGARHAIGGAIVVGGIHVLGYWG